MKLDYETVYRAVKGDHDAQEKLLQYYDAYISALSTVVEICSDGTEHQYVCEDQKAEIQTKYLEALSKPPLRWGRRAPALQLVQLGVFLL